MPRRTPEAVIVEIQRRAKAGRSLRSGDDRGDWLYASACLQFGSWRAGVEAAGEDYDGVRVRPLEPDEVLSAIVGLHESGARHLASSAPPVIRAAALKHFGSWDAAVQAAGLPPPERRTWTREKVIERLRADAAAGHDLGTNELRRRDENLYVAARRRFGSLANAVAESKER